MGLGWREKGNKFLDLAFATREVEGWNWWGKEWTMCAGEEVWDTGPRDPKSLGARLVTGNPTYDPVDAIVDQARRLILTNGAEDARRDLVHTLHDLDGEELVR